MILLLVRLTVRGSLDCFLRMRYNLFQCVTIRVTIRVTMHLWEFYIVFNVLLFLDHNYIDFWIALLYIFSEASTYLNERYHELPQVF